MIISMIFHHQEEPQSLAESLREAAEAAQQQTGFVFDDSTGLYYDKVSGYYYDAVSVMGFLRPR